MSELDNNTVELSLDEMDEVSGGYKRPKDKKGYIIYQIKKGDRLGAIARTYHTTCEMIMKWNPKITNPNKIYAGDYIYIKQA